MTFTYDLATPTDITRVRFHIGDVIESGAIFQDEELQFVIDEAGDYQQAVIDIINSLIARLSAEPDFKADWLQVDSSRSLDGYKALLAEKRRAFGISAVSSSGKAVYRSDSDQTAPPSGW